MKNRYAVNWSDAAFPRVYRDDEDGTSLAEAKREIIEHFRYNIDHARNRIAEAKSLRARDIPDTNEMDEED